MVAVLVVMVLWCVRVDDVAANRVSGGGGRKRQHDGSCGEGAVTVAVAALLV